MRCAVDRCSACVCPGGRARGGDSDQRTVLHCYTLWGEHAAMFAASLRLRTLPHCCAISAALSAEKSGGSGATVRDSLQSRARRKPGTPCFGCEELATAASRWARGRELLSSPARRRLGRAGPRSPAPPRKEDREEPVLAIGRIVGGSW